MITGDKLAVFAAKVREMYDAVRAARGREAERLVAEMTAFVEQQTEALLAEGLSIMKIQTALLDVVDAAEQAYAPDAESDDDSDESLEPPVVEIAYFVPLEETVVTAYRNGLFDAREMMARVCGKPENITPIEMPEGLDLVLDDFGRQKMPGNLTGGEAVCGADGEAFIPEYLNVREQDGYQYVICDPMVFKTAEEVQALSAFLETVDKKTFFKKAKNNKIIKLGLGWINSGDKQVLKMEVEYIIGMLWDEFSHLQNVCRKAVEQKKGLAVFMGYMEEDETYDDDDFFDDDEMIDEETDGFDDERNDD